MAVEIYKERDAIVLGWEAGSYTGPVTIRTEAPNGDVSETNLVSNPGYAAVTVPTGDSGSFTVEVFDEHGNAFDTGTITY
jgi:hypothetical protein